MNIRTILITGDDGYNSPGTRLLAHLLRDTYDIKIAGTRTQQSAVGGKITLAKGFEWCETTVDGIPALCVDGTPADTTELVAAYYKEPFDLVISGINWGANLGTAVFGSGTVNAALRNLSLGTVKKAIAVSWDLPPEFYVAAHTGSDDIQDYLEYPGKTFVSLLEESIQQDFWGADLLNINFPYKPTNQVKMTQLAANAQDIYDYSTYHLEKGSQEKKHFDFTKFRKYAEHIDDSYDAKTLTNKQIAITPCKFDILNEPAYKKYKAIEFDLHTT